MEVTVGDDVDLLALVLNGGVIGVHGGEIELIGILLLAAYGEGVDIEHVESAGLDGGDDLCDLLGSAGSAGSAELGDHVGVCLIARGVVVLELIALDEILEDHLVEYAPVVLRGGEGGGGGYAEHIHVVADGISDGAFLKGGLDSGGSAGGVGMLTDDDAAAGHKGLSGLVLLIEIEPGGGVHNVHMSLGNDGLDAEEERGVAGNDLRIGVSADVADVGIGNGAGVHELLELHTGDDAGDVTGLIGVGEDVDDVAELTYVGGIAGSRNEDDVGELLSGLHHIGLMTVAVGEDDVAAGVDELSRSIIAGSVFGNDVLPGHLILIDAKLRHGGLEALDMSIGITLVLIADEYDADLERRDFVGHVVEGLFLIGVIAGGLAGAGGERKYHYSAQNDSKKLLHVFLQKNFLVLPLCLFQLFPTQNPPILFYQNRSESQPVSASGAARFHNILWRFRHMPFHGADFVLIYMRKFMRLPSPAGGKDIIMKKLLALALALMLFASAIPAALAFEAQDVSVTYTGETVDATGLSVGQTFYWTLSISAASQLYSGQWLVDYPEEYLTPTAQSSTWSGSLASIVNAAWDNGNPTSDIPTVTCNLTYEGMTGSNPQGVAGNMYNNIGMSISTFQYWGVQAGAPFIRIKYRIDQLPPRNVTGYDDNGHYITMPVIVVSSYYYVVGSTIAPGSDYCHEHENVGVVNGKVYIDTDGAADIYTVNFYGFGGELLSSQHVTAGGAATAPDVEPVVNDSVGPHRFYGWDADFSEVNSDLDVHAEYVLVGDVNLDGQVAADDALLALRYSMQIETLPAKNIFAGDVNQSGQLQADDSLSILRYTMGIISSLA